MCSQFNSSSSSSLMVLPKCNFLSPRPILHFQDGCQISPPQDTQEAQNQEDHRQQNTQQQQQQDNKKKEEEELFEDNVKDYNNNNNKKIIVIPQVKSGMNKSYTNLTSTYEKDNIKDYSTKIIPTSPERVSSTRQMMICPPAPKKKKAIQVTKRKLHHDQEERVFLDVYDEVESLFPPALLADLDNKIKKARKTTPIL